MQILIEKFVIALGSTSVLQYFRINFPLN